MTEPILHVPIDCAFSIAEVFSGDYDMGPLPDHVTMPRVLDIGANIGAYPVWLRRLHGNAQFHCYEPNPTLYPHLKANADTLGGISCYSAAVGDPSLNKFHNGKDTRLCGGLYNLGRQSDTDVCECTVIDPEDLTLFDIVKIDAEGSEGYICEHLKFTPFQLVVECHSEELARRVTHALSPTMALAVTIPQPDNCCVQKWLRR